MGGRAPSSDYPTLNFAAIEGEGMSEHGLLVGFDCLAFQTHSAPI